MTGHEAGSFTKIAEMAIPHTSAIFKIPLHIKSGAAPFAGVGAKLASRLEGRSEDHVRPALIGFWKAADEEVDPFPSLRTYGSTNLLWWHVYHFLAYPTTELRDVLPEGTNIGCSMRMSEGLIARVKVNWGLGHDLGQKPSQEDWKWLPGSVFPVLGDS